MIFYDNSDLSTYNLLQHEVGYGGMDYIELAQDRNRCRALVNAVMKLWAPLNAGNFLPG
jgi:hypothetical protein